MTKFFVIFNPAARGERARKLQQFLESKTSAAVTLAATTAPGDAQRLATQALANGHELIVAAGGDGTVNEVINGIGTSGATLGVLRGGTVNVFGHELGIPNNLAAAWAILERGQTRAIDLACAHTAGDARYFVQLAGVGFDAWAVQHASWELKKKIGSLSYLWAGLKGVGSPHVNVEVATNGSGALGRGVAVLIGNGRFYGGRFALFPDARLDDGKLDVCVFESGGYLDVLRYAQGVVRGVHTKFRDVRYFQAEHFECRASGAAPFEVDGELAGAAPVRFTVIPRALRVVAPH
jgi:YegS/Rv2252/BmrU family lipid kinase